MLCAVKAMKPIKKTPEQTRAEHIFKKMIEQLRVGDSVDFQIPDAWKKLKPPSYTFIKRSIRLVMIVWFSEKSFPWNHKLGQQDLKEVNYTDGIMAALRVNYTADVYLTKKIKRRYEDDGIFCSCSPSPGSSSVCGRDCHCGMLLSSCSSNCKCGNSCVNKPFHQRTVKKVKLVKTERCGSGLVADEDIKQGDFVIEYVGEVIDDKTCEERLWELKDRGETNFYLCEVNRDMVIDATYKGNRSRYINHSCQPNTEMQKWRADGETRIGIFATRDIKKGEELTYDYQFVQFGADQDCYCGTLGCRRKLGAKPSKPKLLSDTALRLVVREVAASSPIAKAFLYGKNISDSRLGELNRGALQSGPLENKPVAAECFGKHVRIWCTIDNRYYEGMISHFHTDCRMHTILYDDGDIELLDMSKEKWDFVAL